MLNGLRQEGSSGGLLVAVLVLSFFVSAYPARAQVTGGTLTGTVTDPSGAVVPGAKVSVKNTSTGVTRDVMTNSSGLYAAPNLLPGSYDVTISALGFRTEVRSAISLTVGQNQVLNVALQVGKVTNLVQVTGAAPTVQLASSSISAVVNATTVRELPLNGRDWTLLATLDPGIDSLGSLQQAVTSGYNRGNRGYGTELTISGARPQQNNYRIDGITVNDYANSGPGSVLGGTLGVDAIEEFSVLSSNYSAEYGRTSGGVVNAITRSGTNQFHGDAYEFLRNSNLDAANFFDNAGNITKPPFRRNQFGAAAGGPIRKDRTFFFGDYEGVRQSLGVTARDTVPSGDARNGILHNSDGTTTPVTVSPLVTPFLPLWPLPNGSSLGNTGIFSIATQQATTENFATGRIDHHFSDTDNLSGSYQYDKGVLTLPDKLNDVIDGNNTFRQLVTIEESHTFSPELVNNLRAGYNRNVALNDYGISTPNPLANNTSLGAVPGQNAPQIGVAGLTFFFGGLNAASHYDYYWNSFQGYDDAFLAKGAHSIKFGAGIEQMEFNALGLVSPGGQYTFGSLEKFLTNQPTNFTAALPKAVTPRGFRQTVFGAYVQDDFRWRPSLTLNAGVRYEMSTVPTEVQGKLTTLRTPTDSTPHLGSPFFSNPTYRNFEPRIGFAWDPLHNGKTSVRGGFGLFDVLPLTYEYFIPEVSAAPFLLQGKAAPLAQDSFPVGAFNLLGLSPHLRTPYVEFNPRRNYVMQWNVSLQRELAPNLTATLAYVGSRGVHQPFRADDANIVIPSATPQGYEWPCGGPIIAGLCSNPGTGTTLNPVTGRMDTLIWSSNSFYDGLELQVTKRMSHGFQIQGSYTWSKSIDEGSASMVGDPFANSISSQFFFDRRLRRGVSDYNIAQNAVINYLWNVPTPHSMPGAASWILGGWQLGGIFQASTGLPFTPILGGDPLGLNSSDPWDFPNHLAASGCQSAVNPGNVDNYIKLQCLAFPNPSTLLGNTGRNSLTGPGLASFDFSLYKNNYVKRISENFNVQFRAEFFNVFNRSNFQAPIDNETVFDQSGNPIAGAGLIDQTSTAAREIQFALKVIW
ncbi:MAG: carboxypeptidase regulatory-like domain-containing protein [Terriglobia bacterium]